MLEVQEVGEKAPFQVGLSQARGRYHSDDDAHLVQTYVGTPLYLSPELIEARPYDFKSDMWALGVILYELLTLRHPFAAENLAALALAITRAQVARCYLLHAPPAYHSACYPDPRPSTCPVAATLPRKEHNTRGLPSPQNQRSRSLSHSNPPLSLR